MPGAILIYETSSGYTEKMALAIKEAMEKTGVQVLLRRTMGLKVEEFLSVDAVVLGSPTYNNNVILPISNLLSKMESVNLKGKIGAAFGSYGFSGEAVQIMIDKMRHTFGMDIVEPGLKQMSGWDESRLQQCMDFGNKIAEKINSRPGRL